MLGEYYGANEKTTIHCKDCDYTWEGIPRSVINSKTGCPKCKAIESKREKAKQKFLEKLDQNKFEFIEYISPKEVVVKCKTCGNIRHTTPSNIYRYGCKKCSSKKANEHRKLTTEEFISRAREIHKDAYDYSKVNYIDWNTPVIIICSKHGEFLQSPGKHLAGHGCRKCKGRDWTNEDFIKAAREVHGDKYDYSKVKLLNKEENEVCIICPEHGEFWQLSKVHIKLGCGCPKCSESHGERLVSKILDTYNIKYKREFPVKNPYEGRNFKLDFAFKYKNQLCIIEYHGAQHYRPIEYFGGEEIFQKQVQRDSDLRKFC